MAIKLEKCSPATESEIAEAEQQLGEKLPVDYRTFLLEFNAAIPEDNVFGKDLNVSVERFIPVGKIATHTENVDGFPNEAVPIAEAPSGNFVYFKKGSPKVYFWDHEIDCDKELASSFSEFLNALNPFDMDSVQLKPGQVKSVWVDPDFKPEFD